MSEATSNLSDADACPCPPKCGDINTALKVIGDKWTGFIVRELMDTPRRFSELEQRLGIGPRTLSQRLDVLAEQRIIIKKQFAEAPPRVEYSLTQKGQDLLPVLQSMADWTSKYTGNRGDK